jgi:hypothetical protein
MRSDRLPLLIDFPYSDVTITLLKYKIYLLNLLLE